MKCTARGLKSPKINVLQPKLKISQPGDAYEQEADRVADQVIRMPGVSNSHMPMKATRQEEEVDRKCMSCEMKDHDEKEEVEDLNISRRSLNVSDFEAKDQVTSEINGVRSSSSLSLESSTKEFMESRFARDFSNVRIHVNERAANSAQSVNAVAYTVGNDVVFGRGQYHPYTLEGKRLLAHELTHVTTTIDRNFVDGSGTEDPQRKEEATRKKEAARKTRTRRKSEAP